MLITFIIQNGVDSVTTCVLVFIIFLFFSVNFSFSLFIIRVLSFKISFSLCNLFLFFYSSSIFSFFFLFRYNCFNIISTYITTLFFKYNFSFFIKLSCYPFRQFILTNCICNFVIKIFFCYKLLIAIRIDILF